jgi:putative FmdB family regulatory protein
MHYVNRTNTGTGSMPTYDYRCKECGHTFEEFQSMTSDALVICPKCGKASLKRLMGGGGGMVFKGSGFYQTDYKKTGAAPSATPAAPAKPETTSKPPEKPAAKPDTPSKESK